MKNTIQTLQHQKRNEHLFITPDDERTFRTSFDNNQVQEGAVLIGPLGIRQVIVNARSLRSFTIAYYLPDGYGGKEINSSTYYPNKYGTFSGYFEGPISLATSRRDRCKNLLEEAQAT